jgi:ribonuclease PH
MNGATSVESTRKSNKFASFFIEMCGIAVMQTGTISRAAGSAYAEFGNTKVIVGV